MSAPKPPWLSLPAEEKGFVLAASLLGAQGEAAGQLQGESAGRCEAALVALAALPRGERLAAIGGELAQAVGNPGFHSWLAGADLARLGHELADALSAESSDLAQALLVGLPRDLRSEGERRLTALGADGPLPPPLEMDPVVRIELQRALLARLLFR